MHTEVAAIAVDAVVAYSVMTDSAWVFAKTLQGVQACTTAWPLSFLHLVPFTLNSFFSMAFSMSRAYWHIPLESAMMKRSSAYRSSQGTPEWNSHIKASYNNNIFASVVLQTCQTSHCEIKSPRIWPFWKPIPIRFSNLTEFSDLLKTHFVKK